MDSNSLELQNPSMMGRARAHLRHSLRDQKTSALLVSVVLVSVAVLFSPVRDAGLVWDDHLLISTVRFEQLSSLLSPYLPTEEGALPPYFRPLVTLTFAIEYRLFGLNPVVYHVVNLVLHLANTLLVMRLAQRFWPQSPELPVLSGLVFGVHPVHVEVVAWIAGRPDLLATLLTLLALERYTRVPSEPGERREWSPILLSSLFWFLGLLAKESATPLPAWLLSFGKRRPTKVSALLTGIAFVTVGLIYAFLRGNALNFSQVQAFPDTPLEAKLPMVGNIFLAYLERFLLPEVPCAHWELAGAGLMTPWGLRGLGILLGLLGWMAWLVRTKIQRRADLAVLEHTPGTAQGALSDSVSEGSCYVSPGHAGMFWMVLFLLPVVGLLPIDETVAERYLYLPSVGLSWWMASLLCTRWQQSQHTLSATLQAMKYLSLVVWIGYCVLFTASGIQQWKSDRTLMDHEVQCAPESGLAHMKRGEILRNEGETRLAEEALNRAIALKPGLPHAHSLLAALALERGEPNAALLHLERALHFRPPTVEQRLLLARTLLSLERVREAEKVLLEAQAQDPDHKDVRQMLGVVALRLGKPEEAVAALSHLIEHGGGDADVYSNRGIAFMMLGSKSSGLNDFLAAARLGGETPRLACNVGRALLETGDLVAGCAALSRCITYGQAPEQAKSLLEARCSSPQESNPKPAASR